MATPAAKPTAQPHTHIHPDNAAIAEESAAISSGYQRRAADARRNRGRGLSHLHGRGGSDGQDMDDWLEAERRLSEARREKA